MIRLLLCAVAFLSVTTLAHAQAPNAAAPAQNQQAEDALEAATAKLNAYVALMNRTLRASESIARYESWVDKEKGPVNKNRAFGVYELFDVADEIAEASEALKQEPKLAGLDASMKAYIEAYSQLSPIIDEANGYYERKDYLDDNLAKGREIHVRLMPAAKTFLAAREKVEQDVNAEKANLSALALAAIERREGRKARWHRTNLMMAARRIVDRLPDDKSPVVDVAAVEADVTRFADAVKEFDAYRASDSGALENIQAPLRSFLAAARDYRDAVKPVKGDVRRAGGQQLQAIVNSYNALVGSANNAAE